MPSDNNSESSPGLRKEKVRLDASSDVKIADIQFSFKNDKMIEKLRERGTFIAANKYDDMRRLEKDISGMMQDKEMFEHLTIPTSAFITFETDDAQIGAINLETDEKLLGKPMKFVQASEPTDIIWENRKFTLYDTLRRNAIAYAGITVMLVISGVIIFLVSTYAAKVGNQFPAVNCD